MDQVEEMEMLQVRGMGVSAGVAIGRAVSISTRVGEVFRLPIAEEDIEAEVERFHEAVRQARAELGKTRARASEKVGDELAAIFDAHVLLLNDPAFLGRVVDRIRGKRVNAEWAVSKIAEEIDEQFAHIDDSYLRERSEDVSDVSRHVLRALQGISHHELSELEDDLIIIADDLTPSDAVRLGRKRVVGFAIETGGRTSHTTIIARSLHLPAVVGLEGLSERITDAARVILDGDEGILIVHPTPEVLALYRRRKGEIEKKEESLLETRDLATVTRDGVRVHLMANIDLPEEVDEAVRFGAEGVGLYRSEFLYIEKSPDQPTEEEHYLLYRRIVETAAPHPAIIRTYDLGGRKLAREMMDTREENPVLGLRGIRLTLARREVFRPQLRGLFRAALHGDLWIMLPMVSTLEEIREFRAYSAEVMAELERDGVPFRRDIKLGSMIEVPAAAMIADALATEVDFFSIGTNDLIQYSLAVDRNNEHVAHLYQPLHPAILRMLRFVVASAAQAGIEVSLCGEMAADTRFASVLVGLGLRRLSVSPRLVPKIKTWIRELDSRLLAEVTSRCLDLRTAREVDDLVDRALADITAAVGRSSN
ncbi:MAG TPA: phosphoenolpyruvate--protein phosphotransferase [Thermoanaerobaculia bacterium]|nr:phosphoenolpyruvate--protein phosphotransferase [Thermoanaerobaculia bacterium]